MAKTTIDSEAIRALADLLHDTGLNEIEYESGSMRVRVVKTATAVAPLLASAPVPHSAPTAVAAPASAPTAADPADHPGAVKAPMVGVVYHSNEPGAAAFVKVGDTVTEGQTLVLIEAMKTFNPVRAPKGGTISAILVEDATPVEYGEPLVVIE